MRKFRKIESIFPLFILLCFGLTLNAQSQTADTISPVQIQQKQFYDSLKYKASQKRLTQLLYDFLISPPRPYVDKKSQALQYYGQFKDKLITEIEFKRLDVFGPTFKDTSKTASNWMERAANNIHTKSNLSTIQKLLLFKVGDFVDPENMYENERIIRSLPYIKDVLFIIQHDSIYAGLVKVIVLTQDRFSFGVTGNVRGHSSAAIEFYNQNIFGVGHEISFRFIGHVSQQPYLGIETYYKIKNINGKFIDITTGYLNTYQNKGFVLRVNKPFITPSIKWGFGAHAIRMFRTYQIVDNDPIRTQQPMDLSFISAWGGHSFNLTPDEEVSTNLVLSMGFNNKYYFHRPAPEPDHGQYFSNSTFYLAGITIAQRQFVQDQLVYSYGITEDIPQGFKNEIVYGYDVNEFGDRHYAHIFLSNGNLLAGKKGYLYLAASVGGYFTASGYQQGQIQGNINFISKQINAGRKRFRLFTRANYTLGLQRYDIENLTLNINNHIRGFRSRQVFGKQRLSLNLEYVLFMRQEFYNFNMAFFGFSDIGVIGSSDRFIFTQKYYSGVGVGLRLHNENLVFNTFQLRLAFYPFHPDDMSFVGFILDEQSKRRFYSFEPTAPLPFRFE
jgi:hypothetical protein